MARRNKKEDALNDLINKPSLDTQYCVLCDRPLGRRIEAHHIIPKSKGGTQTVNIHPICHRKIHKVFSNSDLARLATIDALKPHPDIQTFVRWLSGKDPDFYRRSR